MLELFVFAGGFAVALCIEPLNDFVFLLECCQLAAGLLLQLAGDFFELVAFFLQQLYLPS